MRSQFEVDFWKHIIMPLKSGLLSEASSALNLLLVLSRDDCTLPQLQLGALQGLLASLMSHLRSVLDALFPDKVQVQAGSKRSHNQNHNHQPPTPEEENIYKINFKKVHASRLQSKFSKRKVRIRNVRARHSLLPQAEDDEAVDENESEDESSQSHVILPIETEKESKSNQSEWTSPSYTLKSTSHFLLADKDAEFDGVFHLTTEQLAELDDLDKLDITAESRKSKRKKFCSSTETLSDVDSDEMETDFFDIDEDPVVDSNMRPMALTARLNCLFAIIRNLSFLPGNWKVLSESSELLSIILAFLSKSRSLRLRSHRHVHFTIPEKFYWDASLIDQPSPPDQKADVEGKMDENALEWLREVEPYWARFFGEFTLSESTHIATGRRSWRKELLDELSDDSMIIFNNLALEIDFMDLDTFTCNTLINTYMTLAASRASQNEVSKSNDRQVEPISTYRMVLETLVRFCTRDENVDLILATRPFKRQQKMTQLLFENIQQDYSQILKEMSITLLNQIMLPQTPLTQAAAKMDNAVKSLLLFIDNHSPDCSMHTRRLACEVLVSMSYDTSNHGTLLQYESQIADMFGNSIIHPEIQSRLADVLFQLTPRSPESKRISRT